MAWCPLKYQRKIRKVKQTSSALTFLLAQYRAIFKRAYVKGIASAVLLTAGLAAGAAQAADQSNSFASGGEIGWNNPTDVVNLASGDTVTASGDIFTNTLTGTGAVAVNTSGSGRVIVKDSMTLNNATLTLSGTTNGAGIFGFTTYPVSTEAGAGQPLFNNHDKVTNFSATNTAINITGTQQAIIFNNMTINNSSTITSTIASGSGIGADDGGVQGTNRGNLVITGGTYNLNDGSFIYGRNVNIEAGTVINASGSGNSQNSFSQIFAQANGVMNFEGTLNVASGDGAKLQGATLNLTDTSIINNSGTLILGRADEGSVININGATITNAGNGYIWAQADVVMTDGSITLQSGQGIAGLRPADDSFDFASGTGVADFTATGGTITLADADIAMLDVTLGGNVEVTLTGADNVAWQENSHIDAVVEGTEGGVFTIQDNASVTMNNGSVLTAENFNLNGGTITMQASGDGSANNTSGSAAIIRGFGDSYVNLNGGAINVVASKAGVIRGENINLTGTEVNNQGTLTFAGSITNEQSTNVNTVTAPATFKMTGGTLSNATGANLYFGVKDVNNSGSNFTIAGGTFTNAGTANVASGSTLTFTGTSTAAPTITNSKDIKVLSGGTISTAGVVTVGGTAGTIDLASGSTATFGGEDAKLYGSLVIASGANASITGKVTFYGDATSGDADITSSGDLNISSTGTLIIDDAANSLGLTYTAGADGAVGNFNANGFAGLASGSAGSQGIIYLNVANVEGLGGTTIASEDLASFTSNLKTALGSTFSGTIKLDGVTFETVATGENNTVSFDQVEDALATGVDVGYGNTSVTVSSSSSAVQGAVGQVALTENAGGSVTVGTKTPLVLQGHENAAGVSQGTALVTVGTGETATVGGAALQTGSNLQLNTANGTISNITANADNTGTVSVMAGSNITVVGSNVTASSVRDGVAESVTRGDIGNSSAKVNEVVVGGNLDVKDVYVTNLNLNQADAAVAADKVTADNATVTGSLSASALTTQNAEVAGAVNVTGTINAKVTGDAAGSGVFAVENTGSVVANKLEADTATLAGTTQVAEVSAISATFDGGSHTITKSLEVTGTDALVITNGATLSSVTEGETSSTLAIDAAAGIRVDGNATLAANEINTLGDVYVGADASSETIGATEGAGSLSVNTLSLNDNNLIVDPAFGGKFSFVGVGSFSESGAEVDAGVMDGNAYALQNAILAIGETDEAVVSEIFAQYINPDNQSLGQVGDKVGSIVYVAQQLDVAAGNKLVADSTATVDANGDFDYAKYGQNDAYIGDNSVLAISVGAASNADAAIKFADSDAQITASTSGKVVITGDYNSVDSLNLFSDAGGTNGSDVAIAGANGLRIETLNGLMYYNASGSIGALNVEEMHVDQDKVASAYTDTSSSVRNSIISYVTGDTQWYNTKAHDINETRIHGARVDGVNTDGAGNYYWRNEDGSNGTALTDEEKANLTFVQVTVDVPADEPASRVPQTQYIVYEKANNAFLTAIREQVETRGAAADAAAHMAEFGGVAQVALKAGAATTDAIAGRMGMGAQNSAITFANNGQGAGIWVTPIYMSSDSDGFDAQGVDYGTDINLYGVALGGDYTLANGVRVGAMFNVGSGDADGQGAGSAVTSDFDYYGFGLYAGYSVGQFSVVGDVSYTAVDNDVEASTNIAKLETSLDSSNLSLGVTA